MTSSETHLSDLDWTAFRYVSGELSVSEVDSFEQILADDLQAALAVSRAVQTTQAIQLTVPKTEPAVRSAIVVTRRSDAAWRNRIMVVLAAACVLVVATLAFESSVPRSDLVSQSFVDLPEETDAYSVAPDAELVAFWVDSESALETELAPPEVPSAANVLEVPDWLLAAVDVEAQLGAREPVKDQRPTHN
ncbi:MAG: hypothetical protein O3A00_00620 [Planctomycetota bacterium]|nr:hypothetical protein [Planctomycetota bacterium]